ncbi:MAG: cell division protein ZapA [Candidatus Coatesbacteria bacterium]|nr:cell division protein ZapA [Candidatus Coatesbacteria bacterium]
MSNKVKVTVYGTEYNITSDADPEHILRIAKYVDQQMKRTSGLVSFTSTTKIAILTALNIADELYREKLQNRHTANDLNERIGMMVKSLDDILEKSSTKEPIKKKK